MSTAKNKAPDLKTLMQNRMLWLFPLVVVGVIVISFMLVLLPQLNSLIESREVLKTDEERLERLTQKRTQLESLSETQLGAYYDEATRALPNEKPVALTLMALAGIAEAADVRLMEYDFSPGSLATESAKVETADSGVGVMPVSFVVEGSYDALVAMMRLYETTLPLMQLESAEITPLGNDSTDLEATLLVKVYYAPPPTTLGKPSDPISDLTPAELDYLQRLSVYTLYTTDVTTETLLDQAPDENVFAF